ncbi:hypothetical protein DL96DRAFT_1705629 [Flagelloscypha sp. PMI_526]|nr:hypothetical protein DL96DRAFT_1705629 [Flagelloscypha sp. PMI_526]
MPVLASLPVHATFVPPIGLYSDLLSSAYLGLAGYAALPVNIILCFLVFAFMGVFVFQTQTQTRLQKSSWSSSAFTTIPTVVTSLIEKQFQRKHYRSFGRRPVNQRRRIIPYTRLLLFG